jgi:DNA polymerase III epsilon subunit family exonuclease
MSGRKKHLKKRSFDSDKLHQLAAKLDGGLALGRVLLGRGIETPAAARKFLEPQFHDLPSAYAPDGIEEAGRLVFESTGIFIGLGNNSLETTVSTHSLKCILESLNKSVSVGPLNEPEEFGDEEELCILIGPRSCELTVAAENKTIILRRESNSGDSVNSRICFLDSNYSWPELVCFLSEVVLRKYYQLEIPDFVAVDLETTGKNPRSSEIIEIGALKFERGICVDKFETFVASTETIPREITEITGIEQQDLKDAPTPELALKKFIEFVGDKQLVAHNAGFDVSFLRHHSKKYLGTRLQFQFEDTMRLAQSSIPGLPGFGLDVVADYLNIDLGTHHRALSDARTSALIYLKIFDRKSEVIKNNLNKIFGYLAIALDSSPGPLSRPGRIIYRLGARQFWTSENPLFEFFRQQFELVHTKPWLPSNLTKTFRAARGSGEVNGVRWLLEAESKQQLKKIVAELDSNKEREETDLFPELITDWIEKYDGELKKSELTVNLFRQLEKTAPWDEKNTPCCFLLSGCSMINIDSRGCDPIYTVLCGDTWLHVRKLSPLNIRSELKLGQKIDLHVVPVIRFRYGREVVELFWVD